MLCKAIKKAYFNKHLVEVGETLNWPDGKKLPSWLVPNEPVESLKPEETKKNEEAGKSSGDLSQEQIAEIRKKGKDLKIRSYHNMKIENLIKKIAEVEKDESEE